MAQQTRTAFDDDNDGTVDRIAFDLDGDGNIDRSEAYRGGNGIWTMTAISTGSITTRLPRTAPGA